MCCSDEQMRAEVYVIRERGATAAGEVVPSPREKSARPLWEIDAHSSQEAPEPELDLGTLALVAPEALLQFLIHPLEPGHPGRKRIIAAVDLVLAGQRAPQSLVRVAAHRAMSGAGL